MARKRNYITTTVKEELFQVTVYNTKTKKEELFTGAAVPADCVEISSRKAAGVSVKHYRMPMGEFISAAEEYQPNKRGK